MKQGHRGIRLEGVGDSAVIKHLPMPLHRTERKCFKGPFAAELPARIKAETEAEWHKFSSVLVQIDLASCFQNEQEPLFELLSPILYKMVEV